MTRVKALSPDEAVQQQKDSIPDVVIETFNEMLTHGTGTSSVVIHRNTVVKALVKKGLSEKEINQKGWLRVSDLYRDAGWKVHYDAPGYCESYEPYWRFSKK